MDIILDCIPCMLKQVLEASRMVTNNEAIQEKIMAETLITLQNYKEYRNAPDLVGKIHNIIYDFTRNADPYSEIKCRDIKAAKELSVYLEEFMDKKEGDIYWALKTAATGNNIDAAVYQDIDVKKCVEDELEKEFQVCDLEIFKRKLEKASSILVIGDNAGETVFDKVMIKYLPPIPVFYGVRSKPILNDTTEKEAYESGLSEVSTIVSTGCSAPGLILEDSCDEFIEIYDKADIIISKGQGNYEALSEKEANIFFLLKAKCPMISRKLNVDINSYVFKYRGQVEKQSKGQKRLFSLN